MAELERSALLRFSAQAMYELVADIEAYPGFLPGCVAATVEQRSDELVRARLGFNVKGLKDSFATENRLQPGSRIQMRLVDGPFRKLDGVWEFLPLAEDACKVSLKLSLDFGSRVLEGTLSPLLDRAVSGLIEAFRKRAESLHGRG
ncbi:type II toxin-antitoxin system RatA family toxin [Solimonas sp. K1W22B-7]|uniref:type II toxin-antitoxin system RatA family toxin n=1 Tax=Solimonas sp. K1W22B-7 TaxID=2303331 RepID=UPI000E32F836|nr:type II toxin-antitoxin system RatA family toxin [Solimonas sp. K1W22B-7]AXQ29260.1 type II toxin-antitoxin system RatA family toxin [Solimonas sp. K1W22B-7]